jgi:hypothetical protein
MDSWAGFTPTGATGGTRGKESNGGGDRPEAARVCLKGWPVGSTALSRAHFRVWPPFPLPRPGLLEAKLPPPPGSSHTPFSTVTRGLGSARRWAGDLRRQQVALAGSRGRTESSSRPSPS